MKKCEAVISSAIPTDLNADTNAESAVDIWKKFPPLIRNDACFSVYRNQLKFEKYPNMDKTLIINVNEYAVAKDELLHKNINETVAIEANKKRRTWKKWRYGIFLVIWLLCAWYLLTVREKIRSEHNVWISINHGQTMNLTYNDHGSRISIGVNGPLTTFSNYTKRFVRLNIENMDLINNTATQLFGIDEISDEIRTIVFDFYPKARKNALNLTVKMTTNVKDTVELKLFVDSEPIDPNVGLIFAAIILIFFNILINAEIVHRTVAAIFTTFTSIGVLAALHDRPTMSDVVTWVDCESLLLILSMMVLVAFLSDTGFFEQISLYALQISRGRIWPLINVLCVISAVISMFIDNVTTVILITPIVIKLFECLNLDPVPVLPFIILNINIGGLATVIGHPPNLLITENSYVNKHDVNFVTFAMHMSIGVILALIQTNIHLRIQCHNVPEMVKLTMKKDNEVEIWQKCFDDVKLIDNNNGVNDLKLILAKKIELMKMTAEKDKKKGLIHHKFGSKMFPASLDELRASHPITNKRLVRKAITILIFIILLFFVETIPTVQRLSLGWCAFMGVMLLLVITDCELESIAQQIEWMTLVFFGAMFITMECLARLGLIKWIGEQTEHLILLADEQMRLTLAIIIILWFSAISSSVVDSTPVTAMMVKVLDSFARNKDLNLPIKPIVFALAFGPTLGANGNLYGASSNILCADVAEKLGHKITSSQYFKIGFPVMIGNVLLVTVYLLMAHVLFEWH